MKTSFSTANTLREIPSQAQKLVAWTKDAIPGEQPDRKLGKISREDIAGLGVSEEVIPGMTEVFEGLAGGKPVSAPRLIKGLAKVVDAEVRRVAEKEGDAATLTIGELKEIKPAIRPIALIALAYADSDYFGSFADTGQRFERLADAVNGVERPTLGEADAAIVRGWLARQNEDGLFQLDALEVKKAGALSDGVKKTKRAVKREAGADYRVVPYRDPGNGTIALYAWSTNGPNQEGMVICRADGARIAEVVIGDDGSIVRLDPDLPQGR